MVAEMLVLVMVDLGREGVGGEGREGVVSDRDQQVEFVMESIPQ